MLQVDDILSRWIWLFLIFRCVLTRDVIFGNVCAQEWCIVNPRGSAHAFKVYYYAWSTEAHIVWWLMKSVWWLKLDVETLRWHPLACYFHHGAIENDKYSCPCFHNTECQRVGASLTLNPIRILPTSGTLTCEGWGISKFPRPVFHGEPNPSVSGHKNSISKFKYSAVA